MQTKNAKFLDPQQVLFRVGIKNSQTVVDFGAGGGFFSINAAKAVGDNGKVYVVDILESALEHTSAAARMENLRNIQTIRTDLEKGEVEKIPAGCADVVIISNILHLIKKSQNLFAESYRVLKTGGKLVVIDWNHLSSPFGPDSQARIGIEEVKKSATKANLKFDRDLETDSYHFGLIFIK